MKLRNEGCRDLSFIALTFRSQTRSYDAFRWGMQKNVLPVGIVGQESKKDGDCKSKPTWRYALLWCFDQVNKHQPVDNHAMTDGKWNIWTLSPSPVYGGGWQHFRPALMAFTVVLSTIYLKPCKRSISSIAIIANEKPSPEQFTVGYCYYILIW